MNFRTLLAFMVAPLVPLAAICHDAGPGLGAIYAYVLSYTFGIPLFFALRHWGKETLIWYSCGGGLSAASVMAAIFLLSDPHDSTVFVLTGIFGVIGAIEGLCFSLIRGEMRNVGSPNQSTDPMP